MKKNTKKISFYSLNRKSLHKCLEDLVNTPKPSSPTYDLMLSLLRVAEARR